MYDYGFFSYRVQGGLPPQVRGVLEPGQDALLAGRRRRPGDRPPRGLLLLGHGGAQADRPAPQRRHLQPRPPQPRADRDARAGDGPVRHRQPPLPGAGADRAGRGARRHLPAVFAARDLRERRRRGDRHRDQDRAPHAAEAQDRLDPQGLPRAHRARGGRGRRPLLDALPLRPAGRVRPGPVQRPRRDGGGAARRRRRRRGDRVDPRHLRLPAARARLPARGQGPVRAPRRALHRR